MRYSSILSVFLIPLLSLICAGSPSLSGDSLPSNEVVAIKAGRIETITKGVLEKGIIIVRDGKIAEVGKDLKIPPNAKIIDASKGVVMPGIVSPHSRLGLSGAGGGGPANNPHYAVHDELYPFQDVYRQLPRTGVTTLCLVPAGNGIAGQGAVVKPLGDSAEAMALVKSALIKINFQASTSAKGVIKGAFAAAKKELDAAAAKKKKEAEQKKKEAEKKSSEKGEKGKGREKASSKSGEQKKEDKKPPSKAPAPRKPNPKTAPLIRALQRKIPVFVNCYRPAEIAHFLSLVEQYDLNLALVTGPEVYRVMDELAKKKIPVIIKPAITFEPYTRNRMNAPLLLSKAGVKIAFQPIYDSVSGHGALLFKAAELVKYGLSRDVALKALTINPAEMLGASDRVGSIEKGKDANLILLSGDPLDSLTRIEKVMIEGKIVYSEDEYLERG